MKKIFVLILNVFLLLILVSCNDSAVEEKQKLVEKIENYTKDTKYKCTEGKVDTLEAYFDYYSLPYYSKESVVITPEDSNEDIFIYSFEKGTNAEEVKNHLISHTIPNLNHSWRYAIFDNLLFITSYATTGIQNFSKLFPLQFAEGEVTFSEKVAVGKGCIGLDYEGLLPKESNFMLFKSIDEFEPFRTKLLSPLAQYDNGENVLYEYRYNGLNLETLKSYSESDFENYNLLFFEISTCNPYGSGSIIPAETPSFYLSNGTLEICSLIQYDYIGAARKSYCLYTYLISKDISFSQVKYSFYDDKVGLDFLV